MSTDLFAAVQLAPRDPILGLTEAFVADTRLFKVNLGVGVYQSEVGKIPLLDAVRTAEKARVDATLARGYLPIEGIAAYNRAVQILLFGTDAAAVTDGRIATFEALGGTGGLKIGADFLRRVSPEAQIWISDPSWENHRALFEGAGFQVNTYPYYNSTTHGIDAARMIECLAKLPAGAIVVLHGCCHNPTGVDLSTDQWRAVLEVVKARDLTPFIDIAYQGFGTDIEDDAAALRSFAEAVPTLLVASSFSKSFSLYGERVGALSIMTRNKEETLRVVSQVKRVIRTNYSNPPTHGAAIVAEVLTNPELRKIWEAELAHMRDRIKQMRSAFVDGLKARGVTQDFSFVTRQNGMFSYSGLSTAQVDRLRDEFGVYAIGTGRICLAALNLNNIDYVLDSMVKVL